MTDKANPLTIHKASTQHAIEIALLAQQLAAHEGENTLCDADAIMRLMRSDQQPHCQFYVSVNDDENVVGFVMGYTGYDLSSDSYGMHLSDIVVNREYRLRGIGRALLGALAEESMERNGRWLSLTVLESNELAQAFYDSLQFETVDVRFVAAGKETLSALAQTIHD